MYSRPIQVSDNDVEMRPDGLRARSFAKQNPDHAGAQYRSLAMTVDLMTSFVEAALYHGPAARIKHRVDVSAASFTFIFYTVSQKYTPLLFL